MNAYRWSVKLKLALIVFAVGIAVASLWYTGRLVERLRAREQSIIQLWADAQAEVAQAQSQSINPYQQELAELSTVIGQIPQEQVPGGAGRLQAYQQALNWAQGMPPSSDLNFITNQILIPNPFGIPAIITDSSSREPRFWRNVAVPDTLTALSAQDSAAAVETLRGLRAEMDEVYQPIPIEIDFAEAGSAQAGRLKQFVHYDESGLIKELRIYPYVQLLFVGLFILVGYLGFSYVRRSEQSSLWVGMAREAAHQLGTPISSLMGWLEFLRMDELPGAQRQEAHDEIENDIQRLQRVASRFSDIGSMPKLEVQPLAPLIESTTGYMRRRLPQQGQRVTLETEVPADLRAPVNAELFEWVVENLLKNALDSLPSLSEATDGPEGRIRVEARRSNGSVCIDVEDSGCGIERQQWKNVFRPGYSTKKRGWGLGLSLARRIVEDYHGGSLSVAVSKPGEGTTFRIELPSGGRGKGR